ncbi:MAG: fasciclin domain-containing protein [Cryomorphaceae bacterium]
MTKMFTQFKSAVLLWLPMLLMPFLGSAQCDTVFYDAGGPNGGYLSNDNSSWTFCPDNPGTEIVQVTFVSFNVETNWDKLYVYDGPDNTFPQISSGNGAGSGPCDQTGGYWGTTIPGPFTSTDPGGCLHFEFCSDPSVQLAGWEADVECVAAPECFPPVITVSQNPRDCDTQTYSVDITLVQQGFPEVIPSLLASVTSNGSAVPGTGGIFANQEGNTFTVGNLPLDQELDITLQLLGTDCSVTTSQFAVSNGCPIDLECGVALDQSYCYLDNDTVPFLYQSPDGEPITIFFEGGLLQSCCDEISLYDGEDATGELLFSGSNDGNLNGLGAIAESGSLYMKVSSNGSVSCESGSSVASEWNWFVGCGIDIEGCTDPDALNYLPVATEDNGTCLTDGQDCENAALVETLPYINSGNTSAFGNDYSSSDVPLQLPGGAVGTGTLNSNYLNGPEAVFAYTPDEDGFIDVAVTGSGTSTGLFVFSSCPFEFLTGYHTVVAGGSGRFIDAMPVSGGTDYYVVISSTSAPQSFNLTISNTVFDCPTFNANIGDICPVGDQFAILDEDCNCEEIEFDGCTTGNQVGNLIPPCNGVPVTQNAVTVGSYSTVLVQNGGIYTFFTGPNDNIDLFYLTVTSADGSDVLAASPGQVVWQSTFDGNVRFYTHGAADCEGDVTGSASSHQRRVWADCETLVTDCPDLSANFGDFCETEDGESGTVNENCECEVVVFEGCTDGTASSSTLNPQCSGAVVQQANVPIGSYNNVNVENGAVYELNTTVNDFVSAFYITITDEDGDEVLATGINSLTWTSTLTGQIRFYTHGGIDCTSPFTGVVTAHTRSIEATDCDNLIFDCQDLGLDFGEFCTNDEGNLGTVNDECECGDLVFAGCTNGFQFGTQTANCSGAPQNTTGSFVNEYTLVNNIQNGGTYTFSTTTNDQVPIFYVTITNANASDTLATGAAPLIWVAPAGVESVRFYTHSTPNCTGGVTGGASSHTRITTADCSTVIPDCEDLGLNIGDSCDDGDPATIQEVVTEDCECIGVVPPTGGNCNDAISVGSLPYNDEDETSTYLNAYSADDKPNNAVNVVGTGSGSGLFLNGDDVVYAYTPASNEMIDIELTDHSIRTGLWAFSGCPFDVTVGYHTSSSAGGRLIESLPVTAGETYYIVISTWPAPQSTDYSLSITLSEEQADCPDLNANIGTACDDGDSSTINDVITEDCECVGQPLPLTNCGEYSSAPETVFGGNLIQPSVITDELEISGSNGTLLDLNVVVDMSHTFTAEVQVKLTSPAGTEVQLLNSGNCADGQNIQVLFDDAATSPSCNTTGQGAALQGNYAPYTALSALEGEDFDGTWTLTVTDIFPFADGGTLNSWCLIPELEIAEPEFTIFEIIESSEVHNTLETAVLAAGLDEVLSSPESDLTVFAPTDDAFANLPEGVLAALLDDPEGALADVLLAHVSQGTTLSGDLSDGLNIPMLFGPDATITFSDGSIFINNAEIIIADLLANNGVVHVIDAVIDPDGEPPLPTVFEIIQNSPIHTTATAAIIAAGLDGTLTNDGPFTVFAPTDAAFAAIPSEVIDTLLADPEGELTDILLYHVVNGTTLSTDLSDGQVIETLLGQNITVTITADGVFINEAQVILADQLASNGVVHVIDAVLLPEAPGDTDCDQATEILGSPTFAEDEVFTSMAGETASGVDQCQNTDNVQPDQWFFTESIATVMYFRAWGLNDFDAAVEVYEECGGELLACQNTAPAGDREIVILQNTTPGETYYFRVYHGGTGTPNTLDYSVSVAHIPFTKLREEDCEVFDYTPADMIRTELPPNQFLLTNWYFEFTENEAPFNTYEILSPNGSNPNFNLQWFPQAEYGRTYSVRTRASMYQGPNLGDYGEACDIGFSESPLTTQLIVSQALGFYNMCDILEADNVVGADEYNWIFSDGFEEVEATTSTRFLQLSNVSGLNLGSPYAISITARSLGEWSEVGEIRLIAMNNFVPETGIDADITPCDATYPITQVLSAVEICAAEFYTWRFINNTDPDQEDLIYTRTDGIRTINLALVGGLIPGHTYTVQVRAGSGGLTNDYGYPCDITIEGEDPGSIGQPGVIAFSENEAEISIYPNPNTGSEMMIEVRNLSDDMHDFIIEVYDIYGKKVHSENVANNGTFMNVAVNFHRPMAAGVYTVNVISNEKVIGARKLVVQK